MRRRFLLVTAERGKQSGGQAPLGAPVVQQHPPPIHTPGALEPLSARSPSLRSFSLRPLALSSRSRAGFLCKTFQLLRGRRLLSPLLPLNTNKLVSAVTRLSVW